MASTKYDIASSALLLIGADGVASFSSATTASAEQKACHYLYQSCLDQWLSLYPWRFATKTVQLSRDGAAPTDTTWSASYAQPTGMKAMQNVHIGGVGIPYDRFENKIMCDAGATSVVLGVHTYEPSVSYWPGYFVALMEVALANKFAFALAGKIDLKMNFEKDIEKFFRLAKNADSKQQTTRRLPLDGRGSIIQARRS